MSGPFSGVGLDIAIAASGLTGAVDCRANGFRTVCSIIIVFVAQDSYREVNLFRCWWNWTDRRDVGP